MNLKIKEIEQQTKILEKHEMQKLNRDRQIKL
jgi:hypothetical protein